MKRTDLLRRERDIKRTQKKQEILSKRGQNKTKLSVGDYINSLYAIFYHDDKKIYNIKDNKDILNLFKSLKKDIPEQQWDNVIKKAVKKAGIQEKEQAQAELDAILKAAGTDEKKDAE